MNESHSDPCLSCHYRTQACIYIMDGQKLEDACMEKHIWLKLIHSFANASEVCEWKENEEYGYWETGCKATFEFIEGDMDDNSFKFCPYCGKKILEFREVSSDV